MRILRLFFISIMGRVIFVIGPVKADVPSVIISKGGKIFLKVRKKYPVEKF